MSRYRAWINDSTGIHTPSHPFGTRRAAEVFAAHRSLFRQDCFVIVAKDGQSAPNGTPLWLISYCRGVLRDTMVVDAFDPEYVRVKTDGAIVYFLTQKKRSA